MVRRAMDDRAAHLIRSLGLAEHPEGGYYREVFRSPREVTPGDGRERRSALTTIHFLLPAGTHSRWHVVRSDEAWHHAEGAPLELLVVEPDGPALRRIELGPATDGREPVHGVPAGHWQAARSTGTYTLVGCTVGPGFDFSDFALLDDDTEASDRLRAAFPELATMI